MVQTFKCKEPKCTADVEFEYEPVIGALSMEFDTEDTEVEEEVWLTCKNENQPHTHEYKVKYKPSK